MSEDWLPQEPPPAEAAKKSTKQTLVIWAVLVVLFVAIYSLFVSNEPYEPPGTETGYSGWWIAGGVVGGLLFACGFIFWLFGSHKKFNVAVTPGLEALAEGKFALAAEQFATVAKRYRAKPNFAVVALYNQGYSLMRGGDSAAAVGVLLGADRTPKLATGGIQRLISLQLTRCFAIGGDVEKAEKWLEATRKRPNGMADPVHDRAITEAVEGLVLCRQGKIDEARRHFEACWQRFEAYLPINQMREVWLLRAFAISSSTGPRDAAAAEPWLRNLRGTPPGALDWLTVHWPELQTFAITHGVADGRPVRMSK